MNRFSVWGLSKLVWYRTYGKTIYLYTFILIFLSRAIHVTVFVSTQAHRPTVFRIAHRFENVCYIK